MFSNQLVITCAIFQKQLESYNMVHKQINLGHVGHVRKVKKQRIEKINRENSLHGKQYVLRCPSRANDCIDIYRQKDLISVEFGTSLNDLIANSESITFKYGRITVFYVYKREVITRIIFDFLCIIGRYRIDHRKQISILNTAVF